MNSLAPEEWVSPDGSISITSHEAASAFECYDSVDWDAFERRLPTGAKDRYGNPIDRNNTNVQVYFMACFVMCARYGPEEGPGKADELLASNENFEVLVNTMIKVFHRSKKTRPQP